MPHLNTRAIHGIPAFFVGLMTGGFCLGFIVSLWNAEALSDTLRAPVAGLLFSTFGLFYLPVAAMIYVPIFLSLRGLKIVNPASFAVGGAILGFLLSEPWSTDQLANLPARIWHLAMSFCGVAGGLASYWTLNRCKIRDES